MAEIMIAPKVHATQFALGTSALAWEAEGRGVSLVNDCPVDEVDAGFGSEGQGGVVVRVSLGTTLVTTVVIVTRFPASSVLVVPTTSEGSGVLDG
jgi:hypothetical protein